MTKKEMLKAIASVVPPQYRQGRVYRYWRSFLRQAQWWPSEQIRDWQLKQLQHLVQHAYSNTDGYRQLYNEAGVTPEDFRAIEDIRHLPFTTKQLLRDNLTAFSVRGAKRHRYVTTGGSTGIPFGFYKARKEFRIEDAFMHAGWSWAGWRPGQISAVLRGGYVGSADAPWHYDRYHRHLLLSSYFLQTRHLPRYLEVVKRFRPTVLQAYPSSLNLLCDLLRDSGAVGQIRFDLILLGSENLYPWQLRKFEETFPDSRFFSWYGHAEQAILAPWCEGGRAHHLWPFYGYTELLGDNGEDVGQGEEGELIGSAFHCQLTPFIRYRTLDRAVRGEHACSACGRNFETVRRICGRAHEFIVSAQGRRIAMTSINMHDGIFDSLRQFQFLQERQGEVVFCFVPKGALGNGQRRRILEGLKGKLGEDMALELRQVEQIPRTPAGKYRFLDQKLSFGDG